ncbi:hypothetical protein F4777DRAFT_574078 [Nemania sp. FL0916]|nr:hypothetical protein F4777DRAFT_574078 [Nemania sp. FL0916]
MSDIIHKIKDAVTGHHHDHKNDHKNDHVKDKKHASQKVARNDRDLNCAPSSSTDAVDLTGRHVEPDHRDIDGRRRSNELDAPDLTGPHRADEQRTSVDINGRHPSTHNPPDLNSRTASPNSRH